MHACIEMNESKNYPKWLHSTHTYPCHSWICLSFNFFPKATISNCNNPNKIS